MRRLILACQVIAVLTALAAGVVGTVIEADGTAQAVIIACLSMGSLLAIATAIWAYIEGKREGQQKRAMKQELTVVGQQGKRHQSQIRRINERQLGRDKTGGTIQGADSKNRADGTLGPIELPSRRQRIRAWLAAAARHRGWPK